MGIGTATLGGLYSYVSESDAKSVITTAFELGISYFDTAPHYGKGSSERRLGKYLSDYPRSSYVISTKVGCLLIPSTNASDPDFTDFPREILEAGLLDGLSNYKIFNKLVLPLSKDQIVSVGILTLVWAWGDSQIAIVLLQNQSAQPISVGMLSFAGDFTTNYGVTIAGLTMASIPPIILYIILSKYVTKEIALGGITK